MKPNISACPKWALERAAPADRARASLAHSKDTLLTNWYSLGSLRDWAKQHDWPTPFFGFQKTFYAKMFENDENFSLALMESGLEIYFPKTEFILSADKLAELDKEYEDGKYRWLVEGLRDIRRAVEAGVVIIVENKKLKNFDRFYSWAHGRYHKLEDDTYTGWIGDDSRHG